jgi:virulence-associated protein VagC
MDKIEINQNAFLEISDETSDLTIIPLEINWDFLADLRQGYSMKYGATWEMKAEYLSNLIKLKDC